jgi:hypothetical protein
MKNKRFNFKLTILAGVLLAGILGACMNPFEPPQANSSGYQSSDGSSSVKITVNKDLGARTLMPSPVFIKYRLEFNTSDLVPTPNKTEIWTETTGVIELDPADWTLDVYGIVSIGGSEYDAAHGSAVFTLLPGAQLAVPPITISAALSGANGFLAYDVDIQDPRVTSAYLSINPLGVGSGAGVSLSPGANIGREPLSPGYYLVTLQLYTPEGTAIRNEVAHIYKNMETFAAWTITDRDFVDVITLGGSLSLTGFDTVDYINIYLVDSSGSWIGSVYYNGAVTAWSVILPAFSQSTEVIVNLYIGYTDDVDGSGYLQKNRAATANVYNTNKTDINLTVTNTKITLSGTLSGINPGEITSGYIDLYLEPSYMNWAGSGSVSSAGAWSVEDITAFDAPTNLYAMVQLSFEGGSYETFNVAAPITGVYNLNKTDLALIIPIYRLEMGGSINWSGIPAALTSSLVDAEILIFNPDYWYAPVGSITLNSGDASWAGSARSASAFPAELRLVLNVRTSYVLPTLENLVIREHKSVSSSGTLTALNFAPGTAAEGGNWTNGYILPTNNYSDFLVLKPTANGNYTLNIEGTGDNPFQFAVYDSISLIDVSPYAANPQLTCTLNQDNIYVIRVSSGNFGAYRFRASLPSPEVLSGTAVLSILNFADVQSANVNIYGAINPASASVNLLTGVWSANVDLFPGTSDYVFELVVQTQIGANFKFLDRLTRSISGTTANINLSLNPVPSDIWRDGNIIGTVNPATAGDFFLIVPAVSGHYTLDAESDIDTYLSLYNSSGTLVGDDDDGGDGVNPRLAINLEADELYVVQVRAYNASGNGSYRFQYTDSNITLGGDVDFGDLNVTSSNVELYLDGYRGNYLGGTYVNYDHTWSYTIPSFAAPTDVYFIVYYTLDTGGYGQSKAGTINVFNQSINNITLDAADIILSGSLNSLLLNDDALPPLYTTVMAAEGDTILGSADLNSGVWSICIPKSTSARTVNFILSAGNDQTNGPFVILETGISRSVSSTSISGINLGNITALTENVHGTLNAGGTYFQGMIFALKAPIINEQGLRSFLGGDDGATKAAAFGNFNVYGTINWSLDVSASLPQNLWFLVQDFTNGRGYITTGAVSRSGTVSLDLSQMTYLGQYGGPTGP